MWHGVAQLYLNSFSVMRWVRAIIVVSASGPLVAAHDSYKAVRPRHLESVCHFVHPGFVERQNAISTSLVFMIINEDDSILTRIHFPT